MYRIEAEKGELLVSPKHKVYVKIEDEKEQKDYLTPKISNSSLGDKTSTLLCFLSPLSPEKIGQSYFNARATYFQLGSFG